MNINIERKPIGSDYILTDESSDLVNDKKEEEVFNLNNWLVELKATGKNYAAMTSKQAEKATEENLPILFVTQKNPQVEKVGISDLYAIGTTVEVLQYLKLPTGTLKVLSEAVGTAHVYSYYEKEETY